jgi:hypothetical protein
VSFVRRTAPAAVCALALGAAPAVVRADPPDAATAAPTSPSTAGSAPAPASGEGGARETSVPAQGSAAAPAASEAGSATPPASDETRPPRRRRTRRRGLPRARGPLLSIGWRYTQLPTEGVAGATHAVQLTFQPFARERTLFRGVIGAEIALRAGPHDHLDALAWFVLGLGAHLPGRVFTPYASAVFYGGFGTRSRFTQTLAEGAWMLGGEIGADVRIVGFFGLGLAAGVGRSVVGEQYSVAWWLRASVALF